MQKKNTNLQLFGDEEYNAELKKVKEELNQVRASKDQVEQEMGKLRVEYEQKIANVEIAKKNGRTFSYQNNIILRPSKTKLLRSKL